MQLFATNYCNRTDDLQLFFFPFANSMIISNDCIGIYMDAFACNFVADMLHY